MVTRYVVENSDPNISTATTLEELMVTHPEPVDRSALPNVEWELVDRERALHYMESNEKNRKLRKDAVATYARDLRAGRWLVTTDSIKFDHTGRLIDGQHRLQAVIESGVPTWMLMARGLEPEVQGVLDTQARRSAADALRFLGIRENVHIIAPIARSAQIYSPFFENRECAAFQNLSAPSNAEVEAYVQAHPEIHEAAVMAVRLNKSAANGRVAWGLAWIKLMALDPNDARSFFDALANFKTDGYGDPRHTLLQFRPSNKARGRLAIGEQLIAISTAWNAYRNQEELTKIHTKTNGKYRYIPVAV